MAISNDEKIAYSDYSSKWISNTKSRIYAHKIRYQSQAILTTSKTIIKDNPRFTVRKKNKIIIISAIDNLIKGASGQAVQNMNVAFKIRETTGLI